METIFTTKCVLVHVQSGHIIQMDLALIVTSHAISAISQVKNNIDDLILNFPDLFYDC